MICKYKKYLVWSYHNSQIGLNRSDCVVLLYCSNFYDCIQRVGNVDRWGGLIAENGRTSGLSCPNMSFVFRNICNMVTWGQICLRNLYNCFATHETSVLHWLATKEDLLGTMNLYIVYREYELCWLSFPVLHCLSDAHSPFFRPSVENQRGHHLPRTGQWFCLGHGRCFITVVTQNYCTTQSMSLEDADTTGQRCPVCHQHHICDVIGIFVCRYPRHQGIA